MKLLLLNAKGITPCYQGQFNCAGTMVAAEILMRFEEMTTACAIAQLEKAGEIYQLDLLSLKNACELANSKDIVVAANFSGSSLDLPSIVTEIVAISDNTRDRIVIELTESQHLTERAKNNIIKLISLGYKISLDDYGSEFNGLNRLQAIPFSEIKIDRYIISQLGTKKDRLTRSLIRSTTKMCSDLGIRVVAEGVENKEQVNLACELGCKILQGYYFHKPEAIR